PSCGTGRCALEVDSWSCCMESAGEQNGDSCPACVSRTRCLSAGAKRRRDSSGLSWGVKTSLRRRHHGKREGDFLVLIGHLALRCYLHGVNAGTIHWDTEGERQSRDLLIHALVVGQG